MNAEFQRRLHTDYWLMAEIHRSSVITSDYSVLSDSAMTKIIGPEIETLIPPGNSI